MRARHWLVTKAPRSVTPRVHGGRGPEPRSPPPCQMQSLVASYRRGVAVGTYEDVDWAWLRGLTRQRRAEREARRIASLPPTVRLSIDNLAPAERDKRAMKAWRVRRWRAGHRTCEYCGVKLVWGGERPNSATTDHRDPFLGGRNGGGADDPSNYAMACYDCNQRKGALPEAVFRSLLAA